MPAIGRDGLVDARVAVVREDLPHHIGQHRTDHEGQVERRIRAVSERLQSGVEARHDPGFRVDQRAVEVEQDAGGLAHVYVPGGSRAARYSLR